MWKRIRSRLYADYLMRSRLEEYRNLLQQFIAAKYSVLPVEVFARQVTAGQPLPDRTLVLRQDVDTDVATSRAMWEIEQEQSVQASRYFRLSTWAPSFMKEIAAAGGEASYHFEELATYAKRHRIRSAAALRGQMGRVQQEFDTNLARLRDEVQLPLTTVASHGDFVNRRLQVYNYELVSDREFRRQVGVDHEVYDEPLSRQATARFCDRPHPQFWDEGDPVTAIGSPVVYVLTHPRHWRANVMCNFVDDVTRVWQGWRYAG